MLRKDNLSYSMDLLKKEIEANNLSHQTLHLDRNDFIKQAGSVDTNLYLVISGSIRVYNIINQEEHCLYFGYKNSIISAIDSFFSNETSDYYIQAIKKSEISVIKKKIFFDFINAEKDRMLLWQNVLEEIIQHHVERSHDLFITNSAERYERLFKRAPQLFQEIPHKYIASYLRMSAETLSRLKKS